ncbi:efflux RND transporter permease subunit [Balneola vulgaris]|uniref:efflux RND transporter permease subunit n=1 Tax=Balneola vulgaris TaxID=287535 RepID=UPI0003A94F11|nr:efflux RND transporter permease subunit [Balneola vulgaris]
MKELLQRKYLVSFFYLMVCIVGLSAWYAIPVENAPELNLPSITVNYNWGNMAPEIVEQEITRKVEGAVNNLRDVKEVRSRTQSGRSSVTVTFSNGAPVEFRSLELREYLTAIEQNLPVSVSQGTISRQIPEELEDQQAFIDYTLSGDFPSRKLLEYARQSIRAKLLGIDGLSDIELTGVDDPALVIEYDRKKLEKYGLSALSISSQVRERMRWRTSGYMDNGKLRYSLVLPPDFLNTTQVEQMKIALPHSMRSLKLSEIATVKVQDYESKSIRRINGSPALLISFKKESGADAMSLAKIVLARMSEIEENLPEGMEFRLQKDTTEDLRAQFDELANQAIFSGFLVFLVVLLFIRKLRAPVVIVGSVIFSVLMSITILFLFEYTLNVITLAGLTIALGMLIDNAVVVFEQINPGLPKLRSDRINHIRDHISKAVVPVLGSTFTTVGIFIPLLFAMDEIRIFLVPLAVALTITLLSSVVIAFTWIPYSLIWLTPISQKQQIQKKGSRFDAYKRVVLKTILLRNKLRWVFAVALILVLGIPFFAIETPEDWEDTKWPKFTQVYFDNRSEIDPWIGGLSYKFVNETYFGSPWRRRTGELVTVRISSPQGTPLSEIDKIVKNFEAIAEPYSHIFNYYEANLSEYSGASMVFDIKEEYLTTSEPYEFFGQTLYLGARTGNVTTSVYGFNDGNTFGMGGGSSNHRISITGFSYEELYDLAKDIQRRLEKNRRVRNVDVNKSGWWSRDDYYIYRLDLDEHKLAAANLNKREILNALITDINPENSLGKVEFEGQEMYLISRGNDGRMYEEDVMEPMRVTRNGNFDLESYGSIVKEKALTDIRRENQSYQRTIGFDFLGNYRMANKYIEETLEQVPVPVGAKIEYGSGFFSFGNAERNQNLWMVALLSLLSVWMIVSALLESWTGPMFVILTIPFSAIGIMLGSLSNDLSFDKGAISGALLCIGVVVNNAILFIHQAHIERDKGIRGLRCWYRVFRQKMRPVLITTTTTVVGLMPMVLYGTDDFWQSLAVVVIWGLLFSTALLFVFSGLWDRKVVRFKKVA